MNHELTAENMTSAERVLWKANYEFCLQQGGMVASAIKMADAKIWQKRRMAKTLKFKH
jgi:hypothetical protein